MEREKFSSRLGFILISAGCAIGLGNVWRFPYIVGEYGGAAFVLVYLVFLLILGLPIVVMEFAVGRASRKSAALSFDLLEPKGSRWHLTKYIAMAGNYILMMFYTTVGGWMMLYFFKTLKGDFGGLDSEAVAGEFGSMLANPALMGGFMVIVVLLCFGVCAMGLQKGVERITKVMMVCLLVLMVVLAVHSMVLPGGGPGLEFYLKPDFGKMAEAGIGEAVFARALSSHGELREDAQKEGLAGPNKTIDLAGEDKAAFVEDVRKALFASKVVAYAQGLNEIQDGAKEYGWDINLSEVARIWRGGCIIRAQFLLDRITEAFKGDNPPASLLFDPYFEKIIGESQDAWRRVIVRAVEAGIPTPVFSSSLAYYDGLRSKRLPTALTQSQRDFFGAHTYGRVDKPGVFHTLWAEEGKPEIEA